MNFWNPSDLPSSLEKIIDEWTENEVLIAVKQCVQKDGSFHFGILDGEFVITFLTWEVEINPIEKTPAGYNRTENISKSIVLFKMMEEYIKDNELDSDDKIKLISEFERIINLLRSET